MIVLLSFLISLQPVTHINIPEAALRQSLTQYGMTGWFQDALVQLQQLIRDGNATPGSSDHLVLERLLGRKAVTFEQWLEKNLPAFQ